MGAKSKRKGKIGERELANKLTWLLDSTAHRGQQFQGSSESPDVMIPELPGIHLECKRCESLSIYTAMDQAGRDKDAGQIPVVAHRRNDKPWLLIINLDDLPKLATMVYLKLAEKQ